MVNRVGVGIRVEQTALRSDSDSQRRGQNTTQQAGDRLLCFLNSYALGYVASTKNRLGDERPRISDARVFKS